MRAAAGAINRARARARAHLEIAGDGFELGELQGGQRLRPTHLTHAWPRASSAVGQARHDARGCGLRTRSAESGRGRARTKI